MTRPSAPKLISVPFAAPFLAVAAILATPAAAQDEDYAVNQVYIADGEDCPASTAEVITVCGVLEDPYRIPKALRHSDDPDNTAWAQRVKRLEMVGATGIMSCSPVGAGGATGCTQQLIAAAYADKANAPGVRFGRAIEAAREDRLSTIDVDARMEQDRVEQIEREYMERLERERGAGVPGEESAEMPSIGPVTDAAATETADNSGEESGEMSGEPES